MDGTINGIASSAEISNGLLVSLNPSPTDYINRSFQAYLYRPDSSYKPPQIGSNASSPENYWHVIKHTCETNYGFELLTNLYNGYLENESYPKTYNPIYFRKVQGENKSKFYQIYPDYTSILLDSPGYISFTNGFTIQWVHADSTVSKTANTRYELNLPINFKRILTGMMHIVGGIDTGCYPVCQISIGLNIVAFKSNINIVSPCNVGIIIFGII